MDRPEWYLDRYTVMITLLRLLRVEWSWLPSSVVQGRGGWYIAFSGIVARIWNGRTPPTYSNHVFTTCIQCVRSRPNHTRSGRDHARAGDSTVKGGGLQTSR